MKRLYPIVFVVYFAFVFGAKANISASEFLSRAASVQSTVQRLQGFRILIVAGFMPRDSIVQSLGMGAPYQETKQRLALLGLDVELSRITPGDRIIWSVPTLESEIANSPKPVILIGHSLGGLKALHSMERSRNKVLAWIPIQSPLYGTQAAELAMQTPESLYRAGEDAVVDFLDPTGVGRLLFFPWEIARQVKNQMLEKMGEARRQLLMQILFGQDYGAVDDTTVDSATNYIKGRAPNSSKDSPKRLLFLVWEAAEKVRLAH